MTSVGKKWHDNSIYTIAYKEDGNKIAKNIIEKRQIKTDSLPALLGVATTVILGIGIFGATMYATGGNWKMALYVGGASGIIGVPLAITTLWLAIDAGVTRRRDKRRPINQRFSKAKIKSYCEHSKPMGIKQYGKDPQEDATLLDKWETDKAAILRPFGVNIDRSIDEESD